MNSKVYVIILNYNSWVDTIECLASVLNNDYPNFQVVVLDNNSPDNSWEKFKLWVSGKLPPSPINQRNNNAIKTPIDAYFLSKEELNALSDTKRKEIFKTQCNSNQLALPLVFIQTGENRGFAAGNNVFLKFLMENENNAFVFLLNPDMIVEENAIGKLVECNRSKEGIVGVSIYDFYNPEQEIIKAGFSIGSYGTVKPIVSYEDLGKLDFISGSALFCHLNVFKKVGLLPEEYFLYWEEADWCTKATRMGIPLLYCEHVKVFDKGGSSVGGRSNYKAEYFYTVNLFKFYSRYFPEKKNKMYFLVFLRMVKKLIKGDFKVVKAIWKALWTVILSKKRIARTQ